MTKKRKKRRVKDLIGRIGVPVNLRPAGPHASKKTYDRKRNKAVLEAESGFDNSYRAVSAR